MRVLKEQRSADNAIKYLIGLDDRQSVEALYMHDREKRLTYHSTVCVSSQVGCAMGCLFCATGKQGFMRNLTADEIIMQTAVCDHGRRATGCPPIDAVVFAGMGEPLLNYSAVIESIERLSDERQLLHFELATVCMIWPGTSRTAVSACASIFRFTPRRTKNAWRSCPIQKHTASVKS